MPELPEVETVVRTLRPHLVGKQIVAVSHLDWPSTVQPMPPDLFREAVRGATVAAVSRRAKYILIGLQGGGSLVGHLRMTGQLVYHATPTTPGRFTRLVLDLDDGGQLHFDDMRKFGRLRYVAADERLEDALPDLGPEPLAENFTAADFSQLVSAKLARRANPVLKTILLDQSFLSGLGNIYADEALHLSGLHPLRTLRSLDEQESGRLYVAIRQVLNDSLTNNGTSFSDYRDGLGNKGSNQDFLHVYHRTGQPCHVCGTPVEKVVVGGRSTHFCPQCQPAAAGG